MPAAQRVARFPTGSFRDSSGGGAISAGACSYGSVSTRGFYRFLAYPSRRSRSGGATLQVAHEAREIASAFVPSGTPKVPWLGSQWAGPRVRDHAHLADSVEELVALRDAVTRLSPDHEGRPPSRSGGVVQVHRRRRPACRLPKGRRTSPRLGTRGPSDAAP